MISTEYITLFTVGGGTILSVLLFGARYVLLRRRPDDTHNVIAVIANSMALVTVTCFAANVAYAIVMRAVFADEMALTIDIEGNESTVAIAFGYSALLLVGAIRRALLEMPGGGSGGGGRRSARPRPTSGNKSKSSSDIGPKDSVPAATG